MDKTLFFFKIQVSTIKDQSDGGGRALSLPEHARRGFTLYFILTYVKTSRRKVPRNQTTGASLPGGTEGRF